MIDSWEIIASCGLYNKLNIKIKVKVCSAILNQVLYVWTRPRYKVSVYRTIRPLVHISDLKHRVWGYTLDPSQCHSFSYENCHFNAVKNTTCIATQCKAFMLMHNEVITSWLILTILFFYVLI